MRRPGAIVVLLALLAGLRLCWTPPRGDAPSLDRRVLLGVLASQPALAEEVYSLRSDSTATPTGDPYTKLVQSPQGDFSIQLPANWQTEFDKYAGRLILSISPTDLEELRVGRDPDITAVRCARLPLPALLRSAQFMPRQGDEKRSDWKEVALGAVTGANIAEWLMRAGQEAQMAQAGLQMPQINISVSDAAISDGPAGSSVLTWHAVSQISGPLGQDPNSQVQGLGGKSLMSVMEAAGSGAGAGAPGDMAPQATTGKAILRNGIVTFALALSPEDHLKASYKGPLGRQYLDYLVGSLKLN